MYQLIELRIARIVVSFLLTSIFVLAAAPLASLGEV
jgi:hypothetical protein